ncbi:putative Solute carrier family 35 member E3 [Paratrimastix pyriformis]|uniref:Solute carrier family 35 member E3 n=1 Tax=Paratrimastix pyriformis TaxID=342808 RepID=A0ABQ8U7Y5_9EUKA|nr:putative Solute carrier family 35 member E3 [Paratrimastix pyriformis]
MCRQTDLITPLVVAAGRSKLHIMSQSQKALEGRLASCNLDVSLIYMLGNILSSVSIVLVNKFVLREFHFGTTLTFFHFVVTFIGLLICASFGLFEVKKIPIVRLLPLCFSFLGFVVLNNLSIQYNSVGFYQTMKISITPTVCFIEFVFRGKKFSNKVKASLAVVCLGIGLATVNDFRMNAVGAVYGVTSVIVTSFYQIWSGSYQHELGVNAMQLLFYQVPISMFLILVTIPIFDVWLNKAAIPLWDFEWNVNIVLLIFTSCALSFFVNVTIFLVIGRTSAVTYNVASHFKTISVLAGGVIFFGDSLAPRTFVGICICLGGIFYYSYLKLQEQKEQKKKSAPLPLTPESQAAGGVIEKICSSSSRVIVCDQENSQRLRKSAENEQRDRRLERQVQQRLSAPILRLPFLMSGALQGEPPEPRESSPMRVYGFGGLGPPPAEIMQSILCARRQSPSAANDFISLCISSLKKECSDSASTFPDSFSPPADFGAHLEAVLQGGDVDSLSIPSSPSVAISGTPEPVDPGHLRFLSSELGLTSLVLISEFLSCYLHLRASAHLADDSCPLGDIDQIRISEIRGAAGIVGHSAGIWAAVAFATSHTLADFVGRSQGALRAQFWTVLRLSQVGA